MDGMDDGAVVNIKTDQIFADSRQEDAGQEPKELEDTEESDEDTSSYHSLAAMLVHTKVGDANPPPSTNISPGITHAT